MACADPKAGRRRFVLFVSTGAFAALVNIAGRAAFSLIIPYEVAIILAYGCGMLTAFALHRTLVFDPSGRQIGWEFLRFATINAIAIVQVWIVSVGLARLIFPYFGFTWHAELLAHSIGVAVPIFSSYLGHKYFTFSPLGGNQ